MSSDMHEGDREMKCWPSSSQSHEAFPYINPKPFMEYLVVLYFCAFGDSY